ncbi:MAG: tryptophan--tRNA ligase [Alphaproteobacteria bacterium]|nr:tryptophan--tRNA ligase [Alphaproteobacteria bacterium]OJV48033.1 MAG: tryptophan--tRNA ligase [Alphaproteobacteria bacterium 43-37]
MKRILSGIQPTGAIHIGNYLGAIKNWVTFQTQSETLFCVVDLHALTTGYPGAAEMQNNVRTMVACYIACGIDPKKSSVFAQSDVPGHCQLSWILGCITPLGWLNRMTQFKDKAGKNKENASLGLYGYPVLMAADILLYQATHVPVGADQKQHLELARDIATAFNREVGEDFFIIPEPFIQGVATRVMSLRDGADKMSKSDPSDYSRILLTDDMDVIAQKIRKAKTDSEPIPDTVEGLADRPEAQNLIQIMASLEETEVADVLARYAGESFSLFKQAMIETLHSTILPIGQKMQEILAAKDYVDQVLKDGAERANDISQKTVQQVYQLIGLRK